MRQLCPISCLGAFVHANAARLSLGLVLLLLVLCAANKSAKLDAELTSWIQQSSKIDQELQYVSANIDEGTGTTSQLLIQTPRVVGPPQPSSSSSSPPPPATTTTTVQRSKNLHATTTAKTKAPTNINNNNNDNDNILTVEALMVHLEAMAIATQITIDLYDASWSLRDLCFSPTLPDYEYDGTFSLDRMMPCSIKTPLDCFWEGAKLHGPDEPILGFKKWTSLNPMLMVEAYQRSHPHASFPYRVLIDWMRRVGIDTGYQFKPCLDPSDPNCPDTAPNKLNGLAPNIGAALTGGCHGVATNQMHWKEEEIVGGLARNGTGYIVQAKALQSSIQLMGERDLYDYWRKTDKVQDINNWSIEKAQAVLETWQRRFKEELTQFTRTSTTSNSQKFYAMTSKSIQEPIDVQSLLDPFNSSLCFILMTIFACVSFPNFSRTIENKLTKEFYEQKDTSRQSISRFHTILLAIATSILVGLTFIASLGLSSFMNLTFNMATTQILPPLALYYGFNQLIMIANIYSQKLKNEQSLDNLTTNSLIEIVPILTIESLTSMIALLVATIIPVQATREMAFQAITYILLATSAAIILIPSIMTTFLIHHFTRNVPDLEDQIFTIIQNDLKNIQADSPPPPFTPTPMQKQQDERDRTKNFVSRILVIYTKGITINKFIQISLCFMKLCILSALILYVPKLKYGLQLKDIVPQGTEKYEAFRVQGKYFPVYNVFAIMKGNFDYPTNQRLLHEYYRSIEEVDGIVSDENRPKFWLFAFRDWLLEIQNKFDIARNKSAITGETGWSSEASEAAKLGYKLLVQTGRVDNPIDKSQVETNRLVDANGIINPKAFYYYLSAWVSNDVFTYSNSEANFKPEPKIRNTDNPEDLRIERAKPLTYSQIPFLMNLPEINDNLKTISEIRSISQAFDQLNLPNFPTGIPFIFWDQFINLDLILFIALSIGFISIFIVIGLTTTDFSIAAIITIPIMVTLIELYCFMGYTSIPFNNILAVLLISTLGTATVQTVHYITYFAIKDGDLETRTQEAIRRRSKIVLTSLTLLFLCFIVFHYSRIEFIITFSYLLLCLISLNAINSLLLTPVILSIFGPKYTKPTISNTEVEYKSVKRLPRLHKPAPQKSVPLEKSKHRSRKKRNYPRIQSQISLSTISEEPQSEAIKPTEINIEFSIRCY